MHLQLLLSKTSLFYQTHFLAAFIISCIIKVAPATNSSRCVGCQEENICSGITSCKTLMEVRLKDKFGNHIGSNQMGLKFFSLNFGEVLEKSTSKTKQIEALNSIIKIPIQHPALDLGKNFKSVLVQAYDFYFLQ